MIACMPGWSGLTVTQNPRSVCWSLPLPVRSILVANAYLHCTPHSSVMQELKHGKRLGFGCSPGSQSGWERVHWAGVLGYICLHKLDPSNSDAHASDRVGCTAIHLHTIGVLERCGYVLVAMDMCWRWGWGWGWGAPTTHPKLHA